MSSNVTKLSHELNELVCRLETNCGEIHGIDTVIEEIKLLILTHLEHLSKNQTK